MSTGFVHQPGTNPVKFRYEVLTLFTHGTTVQVWLVGSHHANRVAAGMGIYTIKHCVSGLGVVHGIQLGMRAGVADQPHREMKMVKIQMGFLPQ